MENKQTRTDARYIPQDYKFIPYEEEQIAECPELALSHSPMCACGNCPWVRWDTNHAASSHGIPVLLAGEGSKPRCYSSLDEALRHEPSFRWDDSQA
jgi:hypothetical protein